jgi:prepilin-type N-terminal cleavage/methylation domain-containing protein
MTKKPFKNDGFTLIELMLVVAIIGLLAAIAIPKFANLVIKAKEAAIKGRLGTIRSAVSIYYADNEGFYPLHAYGILKTVLTTGNRYLDSIPSISIPTALNHDPSPPNFSISVSDALFDNLLSGGGFAYPAVLNGRVVVNCTHTDSKGTTWSMW